MRNFMKALAIGSCVVAGPLLATTAMSISGYIGSEETPDDGFSLDNAFIDSGGISAFGEECYYPGCIVVEPPPGCYTWSWEYCFGGGGGGGGGGGSSSEPAGGTVEPPNTSYCDQQMDRNADQFANYIAAQLPYGPPSLSLQSPDNRFAEYIAFLSGGTMTSINSFVVEGGRAFDPSSHWASLPNNLEGFIHNHPEWIRDDNVLGGWRRLTEDERAINRYPSGGDWNVLQYIADHYGSITGNHDSSLYLVDTYGVRREFKLSDRPFFQALDREQMEQGVGLAERTREGACWN